MIARARWLRILVLLSVLHAWPASADSSKSAAAQAEAPMTGESVEGTGPIDLLALEKDRRKRQAIYPLSTRVARYTAAAGEAMSEGENDEARTLLKRLNLNRLNPYERAFVFRLLAYVNYMDASYEAAIEYFNKVLAEEVLSLRDEVGARFNIVQLNAALQNWREVIRSTHLWFRYVPEPKPVAFYLLAVAHYQLEEVDESIAWAEKAVDLAPEPKEGWLQLLAALYVQNQDYASAGPVFEELVMLFPKKEYWVQLSLIYGADDNYRHSLAVQQIAYLQGFLSEDRELRRLARSYLYAELPHQAAMVLEKGLAEGSIEADAKAYELLANSWIQAREFERSLGPLAKAARLSEKGDLFVRLGQVHMQREEWNEAATLFQKAIEKGGVDNPGLAQLLLGISYYNDDRPGSARASFRRARKHDKTRKQATDWIKHIENESQSG